MRRFILMLALLPALAATSSVHAEQTLADTPIYAWVGTVYAYARPAYDDYFVRNDGELFGIAGQTAAIEAQMGSMRGQLVKVWGVYRKPAPDFNGHQIVVSEIILAELAPTPTPHAMDAPEALINVNVANVRTGPGPDYTRIGQVYGEEIYDIVGRYLFSVR